MKMKTQLEDEILQEVFGEGESAPSPEKPPKEKKERDLYPFLLALCLLIALISGVFLGHTIRVSHARIPAANPSLESLNLPDFITPALIPKDGISRTGEKLTGVRDIAVHYVANPGTSAMANRNYFAGPDTDSSAHLIVGLEGEVLLCVPLDEKSHATNQRNLDTISIEVCHPDATGRFSQESYDSLVRLLAWLCEEYHLTEENLIRHYDVTGKMCPLYYVEHPEAWEALQQDVKAEREKHVR